jgi:hypothetical protein
MIAPTGASPEDYWQPLTKERMRWISDRDLSGEALHL